MAAHCDFSFLTLLLQRGEGLQIRRPDGVWVSAPSEPNTVLVTLGELLEYSSAGHLRATPHRVVGDSDEPRLSAPVFINPDLGRTVVPLSERRPDWRSEPEREGLHVHRVLEPGATMEPFCFGEAEWARKGRGRWCHRQECLSELVK